MQFLVIGTGILKFIEKTTLDMTEKKKNFYKSGFEKMIFNVTIYLKNIDKNK